MNTSFLFEGIYILRSLAWHWRWNTPGILQRVVLLLLALPLAAHAEFAYATNNGTITITRYSCDGGTAIIPSSVAGLPVTSIGKSAFAGCANLTNVAVPNTIVSIGDWAFAYCTFLTTLKIPYSVTSIGERAFDLCFRLKTIEVDVLNPAYSSVDGVLFNKDRTALLQYPLGKKGSYTLPNNVISIDDYGFYFCTELTSVTFPNSAVTLFREIQQRAEKS